MALITTYEHFSVYPVSLPNAGISSTTNADATLINNMIAKCEPEFLKDILGYELYVLFIDGVSNEEADYLAIKNGGTYVDPNGITQKWEGFVKGSNPIANYTYCNYIANNESKVFNTGVGKGKNENSETVSIDSKIIPAWNEMVKFNFKLHEYLVANQAKYPKYIGLIHGAYYYNPMNIQPNQALFIAKNMWGL